MTISGTCLAQLSGTVLLHRVLIVEPETILRLQLRNVAADIAAIDAEAGMPDGEAARDRDALRLADHKHPAPGL